MKMGLRLNEKMLMDVRTGDEIHVETERDLFERLGMQYIEPGERENVGIGFHFTEADRAKQLAVATQQPTVGCNKSTKISAPGNPVLAAQIAQADQPCASTPQAQSNSPLSTIAAPTSGTTRTAGSAPRRIFLVGDQNLMAPENCDGAAHCRLHAMRCVGMLLQQEASKKRELIGELQVRALGLHRPARLYHRWLLLVHRWCSTRKGSPHTAQWGYRPSKLSECCRSLSSWT